MRVAALVFATLIAGPAAAYQIADGHSLDLDGVWFDCMSHRTGNATVLSRAKLQASLTACKTKEDAAIIYKTERLGTPADVAKYDTEYPFNRLIRVR